MDRAARALWITPPGRARIEEQRVPEPGPDEVLVRTLYSGVSRGTESLVLDGRVPESQYEVMRAPFQEGRFPGPVKYGYLNVGVVEQGPPELTGRTVFCLYPHQTRYVVPATAVTPLPDSVPAARAVLAGTMETAVNAVWDATPLVGDRIAVIGAGMVGGSVAGILAGFPGARVQLVDTDPARSTLAEALGVDFVTPEQAADGCDLVVHASATQSGLTTALRLLAPEGTVLEMSWYGDRGITVPLGEFFHSRRLVLRGSQVGAVSPSRRTRTGFADRMAVALDLLADPRFDALITGESRFDELPEVLPKLASGEIPALCRRVTYS